MSSQAAGRRPGASPSPETRSSWCFATTSPSPCKDSVAAGIEAPLRIYVTANRQGTADITYRTPSAVFAPYRNLALNRLAHTLDPIFAAIVQSAAGPKARPSRLP